MTRTLATAVMVVSVALGVAIFRLSAALPDIVPSTPPPALLSLAQLATIMLGLFFVGWGFLIFYVTVFRKGRQNKR